MLYFIAMLLFFPGKKNLSSKTFFFFCLVPGTIKFTCPSCVCQCWCSQGTLACEFPLRFISLFQGSLRPKCKLFLKCFSSVLGKAFPAPLTSRTHPLGFEPVTWFYWFLKQSFRTCLKQWLHFSGVASIQFSSGNAMVLFKAMFSCLGNSSVMFHTYSSDWASHGLHPHIHPTGINGPWPCAHLRVGIKV